MLLALDIGNSSVTLGLFDLSGPSGSQRGLPPPLITAKLSSDMGRTADEYAVLIRGLLHMPCVRPGIGDPPITAAVIGSVVPPLTYTLQSAVRRLTASPTGEDIPILIIGGGVRTGIILRVDDPASLGADIVANASAAVRLYGLPVIFVDFGTATVLGAVNEERELIGVSIAPGLTASLEGLRTSAAQIPYLELQSPGSALGRNTTAAVRSGLVLGTACLVDGMIDRVSGEMGLSPSSRLHVVATGGLADLILPSCRHTIHREPDLTLLGLVAIYRDTVERDHRRR